MIGYGLACLAVCALTYFDRRASPYAFTILAGWLLGFAGPLAWPWISAASVVALFALNRCQPHWRWTAVTMIAGFMLLLDALYFWLRAQGVQIEQEYATALDWGLKAQLVLIGFLGLWNALVLLVSWGGRNLRGRDRVAFGRVGGHQEGSK